MLEVSTPGAGDPVLGILYEMFRLESNKWGLYIRNMANKGRPAAPRTTPLGRYIAEQRVGLGWSLTRLAKQSGVPQSTLSDIESGKIKPSERTARALLKLADALGVHPDRLLAKARLTRWLGLGTSAPPASAALFELRLWVTVDEGEQIEEYLQFLRARSMFRLSSS